MLSFLGAYHTRFLQYEVLCLICSIVDWQVLCTGEWNSRGMEDTRDTRDYS